MNCSQKGKYYDRISIKKTSTTFAIKKKGNRANLKFAEKKKF
jgi:hypothetical protein